jgi:hypothetical protein
MSRIVDGLRECEDEVRHIRQQINPLHELPLCRTMSYIPAKMRAYIQEHGWLRKYEWRFQIGGKEFTVFMVSDETNDGEEYLKRRRMLGYLLFLEKSGGLGRSPLRIYVYETPFLKVVNPAKRTQGREEINGGYTTFPRPQTPDEVVIYRKEEMMKVFRHEMVHATEPALGDENENEGYVETKATVISLLIKLIELEVDHLTGVEKALRGYRVNGPRYTKKKKERLTKTLRMTRSEN